MAQRSSNYNKSELCTSDRLFAAYVVITNDTTEAIKLLNPSSVRAKTKEKGTLRFARPGIEQECARLRGIQAENRASIVSMSVSQMDEEAMRTCLEVMRSPGAKDTDKRQAAAQYAALRKVLGSNCPTSNEDSGDLASFLNELGG